jgi:hypothetical protein
MAQFGISPLENYKITLMFMKESGPYLRQVYAAQKTLFVGTQQPRNPEAHFRKGPRVRTYPNLSKECEVSKC